MNGAQALEYAAGILRGAARERDNAADPETRSQRYAADQLEHLVMQRNPMPKGRHGAGIALLNSGNDGFASVSEGANGTVEVELEVNPAHVNRVVVAVNGEVVFGRRAQFTGNPPEGLDL